VQILCFASADFEERNWVNAQHLMWRLAARHEVGYVDSLGLRSPRPTRRDLGKIARRLRALARGTSRPSPDRRLHLLSPLALPPTRGAAAPRWRARLLAAQIERALARLGFERPLAWAFLPTAAPAIERLRLGPVVYHCVDAYEANPSVDRALILELEERLMARARVVVASSAPLRDRLGERHGDVRLMANVADIAAYPPPGEAPPEPADLAPLPHPRVGYLGNLAAYKCDLPLLAEAARQRPDCSFVFIGDTGAGETSTPLGELSRLGNVHRLGPRPRAALAGYLHGLDAALVPFVDSVTTRHSFPMKFFEYLACGLPVVARALPGLEGFLRPPHAYGYATPEGFIAALSEALRAGAPPERAARRALAEAHSWEKRMVEVEALLAEIAQ